MGRRTACPSSTQPAGENVCRVHQQLDSRLRSCAPAARVTLLSTSLFCERRVSPSRANTTGWDVLFWAGCLHCPSLLPLLSFS